ncbi:MAG: hypothetical protein IPL99_29785 [Candidatus Competibacteraceae bacterium]|nr:hypothetical protein [Candidatus Competibacteraceae bacterium]
MLIIADLVGIFNEFRLVARDFLEGDAMIYNNAACGEGCARSENVEIQSDRALLDSIQAALGGSPDKPLSFDGKPHPVQDRRKP